VEYKTPVPSAPLPARAPARARARTAVLAAAAAAAATVSAAGCDATTTVTRVLAAAGVRHVRVVNVAGTVSLESWNDGHEIRLRADLTGRDAAALAATHVDLALDGAAAVATVATPRPGASAEIEMSVPPGVSVEVTNDDGPVYALGAFGALTVRNTGGLVRAYGANGPVDVVTTAGSISIEGAIPWFKVKTDVGRVRIASDLEGALTGDSEARVERGRIGVTLPASGHATVDASTALGRLVTNCGIEVVETGDGGRMRGTVGGGGPMLRLHIAAGTVGVWRGVL
jgi:hypothetical protein